MQIDLTGKTVIVTGSTAGIGLAAVKGLATSGSAVVLTRSQTSVDRALAAVRAELPDATVTGFAGDLGTTRDCAALVATHPDCDILVNNRDIY